MYTPRIKYRIVGFTLAEVLIVITIIGIIMAAVVPKLQDLQNRARDASNKSDIQTIGSALFLFKADRGEYPTGMWLTSAFEAGGARPLVPSYLSTIPYDKGLRKSPTYLGLLKDVILFSGADALISTGAYGYIGASYSNFNQGKISSALILAEVETSNAANWLLADKNPGAATYVPGAFAYYGTGSPVNMVGRYSYILTSISGSSTATTDYFDDLTPVAAKLCKKITKVNSNAGFFLAQSGADGSIECLINQGANIALFGYTPGMLGYRYIYVY